MSSTLARPHLGQPHETSSSSDPSIQRQVWSVLAGLYPRGQATEKRSLERFPYPHLLYLTPVDDDNVPVGKSVVVIGKHLSERGLGFYHLEPLPHRRMIASLELPQSLWAGFLIDIRWTRFTCFGVYDSGGKFLQAVPPPTIARAAS
jgi:hypothetical protein